RGTIRHFAQYHRLRTDSGAITDPERTKNLGMHADNDSVAERRMPLLAPIKGGAAEGHPLVERAVVADLGSLADHHPHPVIDEQSFADTSSGMNLDAGQPPPDMGHKTRSEQPAMPPQPMSEVMEKQRVKARITQRNFEARTGSGIAGKSGVDFVAQVSKEHHRHYIALSLDAVCHRAASRAARAN